MLLPSVTRIVLLVCSVWIVQGCINDNDNGLPATQATAASSSTPNLDNSGTSSGTEDANFTLGQVTSESILVNDIEREYALYLPNNFAADQTAPVFLNFHGYGGTAAGYMAETDMQSLANTHGIVLVYPQGSLLDGDPHWNPSALGGDNKSTADDFAFVSALIAELVTEYSVDASRIYAMGYSNGGFMAYGLACQSTDLIAAIVSVSGTMLDDVFSTCSASRPIPTLIIHGTADFVVPYNGGTGYRSVNDVLSFWQQFNQTELNPLTSSATSNGQLIEYSEFANGTNGTVVAHYRVNDGGHIWFDFEFEGQTANQKIWHFLSEHTLSGLLYP